MSREAATHRALLFVLGIASFVCVSLATAPDAAAQLTGGLEGEVIHHRFAVTLPDGSSKVVAEAWAERKSTTLWVRGATDQATLALPMTLHSRATERPIPDDARPLRAQKGVLDAPGFLKGGHLWARARDGVADTGLKLVLEPLCRANCAVVAVEQYHLPASEGMAGPKVDLSRVDLFPLEQGDRVTVFAPR